MVLLAEVQICIIKPTFLFQHIHKILDIFYYLEYISKNIYN